MFLDARSRRTSVTFQVGAIGDIHIYIEPTYWKAGKVDNISFDDAFVRYAHKAVIECLKFDR